MYRVDDMMKKNFVFLLFYFFYLVLIVKERIPILKKSRGAIWDIYRSCTNQTVRRLPCLRTLRFAAPRILFTGRGPPFLRLQTFLKVKREKQKLFFFFFENENFDLKHCITTITLARSCKNEFPNKASDALSDKNSWVLYAKSGCFFLLGKSGSWTRPKINEIS